MIKIMTDYVVKAAKLERQVRVTIPKELAAKAGIRPGTYCKVRIKNGNIIEMEALDLEKTGS